MHIFFCISLFLPSFRALRICMSDFMFILSKFPGGFSCSLVGKESACNAGDPGLIPGLGWSPGEGNVNPLQYSCLENPMDRGTWRAIAHGVTSIGHNLAPTPPPPSFWDSTDLIQLYSFSVTCLHSKSLLCWPWFFFFFFIELIHPKIFPYNSVGKESACNVGDLGSFPGLGRSPGIGNGNPLQYSYPENPMDRGAWQATVYGVAKSQTWLSD